MTNDRLHVSLEDTELMSEVELTVELMIAASDTTGRLEPEAIDRLLGLPLLSEPVTSRP